MKPHNYNRFALLGLFLCMGYLPGSVHAAQSPGPQEFQFHYTDVLGTSMDITILAAGQNQADLFTQTMVEEIKRLDDILSSREEGSTLSRINTGTDPVKCPPELIEVLDAAEKWRTVSGGAFNINVGELIALWKQATENGQLPDMARIREIARAISKPAWKLEPVARTITRTGTAQLTLDAIGKGYVIDRALAAGLRKVPGISGALIDIGGDIRVWSSTKSDPQASWTIDLADPHNSQENARPLKRVRLTNQAIATSGNYERFYTIGKKRYSHILDPRTGMPAEGVASSTVIAPDCVSADALATILSVLPPAEGIRLVESVARAECLIVASDRTQHASSGWKAFELPLARSEQIVASKWPQGHQLNLTVRIVGAFWWRPPLVVWVEDADGKPVRTLAAWGKVKYLKLLRTWWRFAGKDKQAVKAISRATRPEGTYRLVWDGLDQDGNPVEQGAYTVHIESTPDGKKRFHLKGTIECADKAASMTIPGRREGKLGNVDLQYGPRNENK